jgi:DNA-directed RNA polymerase subunit omega
MARITVEDCITIVPNRFELCLVASNRAKSILSGSSTELDRKEKPAVISLREIADGTVDIEAVKENIVKTIKNRNLFNTNQNDSETSQSVIEEISQEGISIQETTFFDENISPED